MKRSDVWWVNFDPSIGGEISKLRMIKKAGRIKEFRMKDIGKAIHIQLELK